MSFSKIDLDNIKSKISIRSELEKKTKLIQKGKDYRCCCPFHEEKTPSCKIMMTMVHFIVLVAVLKVIFLQFILIYIITTLLTQLKSYLREQE